MLKYRVEYAKSVVKDLAKLEKGEKKRAIDIIEKILARDPQVGKQLRGSYRGLWKYRFGDYRIIYSIEAEHLCIFLLRIRHRKDVYRGMI